MSKEKEFSRRKETEQNTKVGLGVYDAAVTSDLRVYCGRAGVVKIHVLPPGIRSKVLRERDHKGKGGKAM